MGLGPHWGLSADEATALARASDACIRSLPKTKQTALTKTLLRWMPWIGLTTTAYIVTMPRIQATQALLAARRAEALASRPPDRERSPIDPMTGEVPSWAQWSGRKGAQV